MGMFNSILADLPCPTLGKTASGEIQIKWQSPEKRASEGFRVGDKLDGILPEYNNAWVKTDFVCQLCSRQTQGVRGSSFIKVMDQQRHIVFVRIEDGTIVEILSDDDFQDKKISSYATDLV